MKFLGKSHIWNNEINGIIHCIAWGFMVYMALIKQYKKTHTNIIVYTKCWCLMNQTIGAEKKSSNNKQTDTDEQREEKN